MGEEAKLKIPKIKKGTVIDHIDAGYALTIMDVIELGETQNLMTIGVNIESKKYGKKDIVKVENVFLTETQMQQISIIAPNASISLIEGFNVIKKIRLELPKVIKKLIKCPSNTCISNSEKEPIDSEFNVLNEKPLKIQCVYCDRILKLDQLVFIKRKSEKKIKQRLEL